MESVDYSDAGPDADFFEGWRKIMKRHIDPGCPEEVNIPQLLAKKLLDMQSGAIPNVNRRAVTKELEKAEKEVVGMIAGVFPRFQTSNIFKEYTASALGNVDALNEGTTSRTKTILPTRVLLCEKHELTGVVVAAILSSKNYSVTVVNDGDIALKKLKEESFAFVLVNFDLPVVNAIQIINLYKAAGKFSQQLAKRSGKVTSARFICMLNEANKRHKASVMSAGYSGVLMKPFSVEDFERVKAESGGSVSRFLLGIRSILD